MSDEKHDFEAAIYGLPAGRPTSLSCGREPLEVLASEYLGALRGDASPNIEAYIRRHPELADEIRETFPLLAAMED